MLENVYSKRLLYDILFFMIVSFLYEFFLFIGFCCLLPKAIYQSIRFNKYRSSWRSRFGIGFPHVQRKGSGPIIWIHAVSMGETGAVALLAKRLKEEIEDATFVVSSTTETGHAEAKKQMPFASHFVYLPLDFLWCVKLVFRRCTPDIVILCESDFWYNFLRTAKKNGAICLLVNGKLSEKSTKRFACFSLFTRKLFSLIDAFCVQSELYKTRFLQLGIPASKIYITGNLKFDTVPTPLIQDKLEELKAKLHIQPQDFVVVIGSTHKLEEEMLLDQIAPLASLFPHIKIIIAPRHPERFEDVAAIIQRYSLPYATWTKGSSVANPTLFLIDAMGILRHCYQLADVAIVAGSFTDKVGGHNILEAQAFGIPVVCGPYMYSQPHLIESAQAYHAIIQVPAEQVRATLLELLNNPGKCQTLKNNASCFVSAIQGATHKNFSMVQELAPQFFLCKKRE